MNIQDFPSNIIIWAIGAPVMITFGVRAFISYQKLKSPLSKYFAMTGLSAGFAWLLWCLPFLITDVNYEGKGLAIFLISTGDALLFSALFLQARVYWYLSLQETIKFVYIGLPAAIVALAGFAFTILAAFENPTLPMVSPDGKAVFYTHSIGHITQIILISFVFLVGIELLKRAAKQEDRKSRLGSISVAMLYITAALGGAINILSSSSTNSSPIVVITYAVGLAFFTIILTVFRILEIKKR